MNAELLDRDQIEQVLATCEEALTRSGPVDLGQLGFWRAVAAVKRRPEWIEQYADRIGTIDARAFERAVWPIMTPTVGIAALSAMSVLGVLLVAVAALLPQILGGLAVLAGTGTLLLATHDLAHYVVGRIVGIRFRHLFIDGPTGLQPGLKIDYASYLRTPPHARAWMHAAGALVTKVIPFAVLAATATAPIPRWVRWTLVGIGVVQIATDLVFSTRQSDWKRFRREMRIARTRG